MPFYLRDENFEKNVLPFLMESIHQGISVIDKTYRIVFINRAAMKLMNIPLSALRKDPSLEHLFRYCAKRGDYGEGDVEELVSERMALTREFIAQDIEREHADGRTVRIEGTPIGEMGYLTIYTDVTEQRAYEATLESVQYELELKLESSLREINSNRDLLYNAMDAVEDGLIILDENGCLVMANNRMQGLYPTLRRHMIQKSHISNIVGFELPEIINEEDGTIRDHGSVERKLHDDRWYRIGLSPTANGGRIAVFSDITDYKIQTQKLQQHTNQLFKLLQKEIALSETQREFVTMASHEFKTPLAIIDSNAQRIQRKAGEMPQERLQTRIGNIRDSVERMQYLINRFMDFSADEIAEPKADARKQKFRLALEKLCLSHMEMNEGRRIEWDLEALPDYACFDQNLLDQCISNILSNALKYSAPDTLVRVRGLKDGKYLKIEVEDEGVGIPKAELSKIFNKYYRASTSSGIAGTGIGLNFAQMVLKEHGGHMDVISEVGVGSCFTIQLPADIALPDDFGEKRSQHQAAS